MAEERRRVSADTVIHARALADNLINQGYVVERTEPHEWMLRRVRRRGDQVVVVAITRPWTAGVDPAPAASPWGPPKGPPAR